MKVANARKRSLCQQRTVAERVETDIHTLHIYVHLSLNWDTTKAPKTLLRYADRCLLSAVQISHCSKHTWLSCTALAQSSFPAICDALFYSRKPRIVRLLHWIFVSVKCNVLTNIQLYSSIVEQSYTIWYIVMVG